MLPVKTALLTKLTVGILEMPSSTYLQFEDAQDKDEPPLDKPLPNGDISGQFFIETSSFSVSPKPKSVAEDSCQVAKDLILII